MTIITLPTRRPDPAKIPSSRKPMIRTPANSDDGARFG
jgi:hypothetical protein